MDDDVRVSRLFCAALWMFVFVLALASILLDAPRAGLGAFGFAVVVSFVTIAMSKLSREQQLVHPVAYRIATIGVLAVALAGVVFALVPGASKMSHLFGVFFGLVAILAYRAVVARGPTRAMVAVVVAMWTWLPFMFLTLIGCRYRYAKFEPAPHWTEVSSSMTLRVLLLMLPVLATAALLSFARRDAIPDARVVR
jgi:hypothetical protein